MNSGLTRLFIAGLGVALVGVLGCGASKKMANDTTQTKRTTTTDRAQAPAFENALSAHLDAIANRDLGRYMSTVADREDVTVLLLSGKIISGKKGVEELHKAWFSDPDWRIETETVRVIETPTFAIALLRITYHDAGEASRPTQFEYFLSLHFALIDGNWQLIFDQNSSLPQPTANDKQEGAH